MGRKPGGAPEIGLTETVSERNVLYATDSPAEIVTDDEQDGVKLSRHNQVGEPLGASAILARHLASHRPERGSDN